MEPLPPNAPQQIILNGDNGSGIRFIRVEGKEGCLIYEADVSDVVAFADAVEIASERCNSPCVDGAARP